MKLRCIESCNKRFIVNKEYEAVEIKTDYEKPLYRMKDEDNIKVQVVLKGLLWKFEIVKENEMKELTLQQAFECEVGTKFDIVYADGHKLKNSIELFEVVDEDDGRNDLKALGWTDEGCDNTFLTNEMLQAKFIPIVETEVNFMEAIKAFSEGKRIKSVWKNNEYVYDGSKKFELEDEKRNSIGGKEILEAKWYIID